MTEASSGSSENIVSVVIPCRNEAAHIVSCLDSVLAQENNGFELEVLVADGRSDDGTRELLSDYAKKNPQIKMVDNPKRITPTALNEAIKVARGNIIVRMDAHTEYAPDYILQCLQVMEETGADNVGGPARTKSKSYVQKAVAAAYHSRFSTGGARFHDPNYEGEVDTVTYGCFRKEVFDEVGLFDEELVRNQDDELNTRLIKAGKKIFQSPRIRSSYYPRSSLKALFRQYEQYGYYKVKVWQKHQLPTSIRQMVPGAMVLSFSGLALGSTISNIARIGLLSLSSLYATGVVGASVHTAAKNDWRLLPILPLVFMGYHWGYGVGYVRGMVDFMVLKRDASGRFQVLTRSK